MSGRPLTLEGATARYGDRTALDSVSLSVEAGDFLCVAGSNGSGKSTLLRAALGLVPLSSGRVALGVPAGYAPQSEDVERGFPATVWEAVLTGTQRPWHFRVTRSDRDAAAAAMTDLGILDLASRRVGELSGGQARRMLLARALCGRRRLLLLDEPGAGLDAAMRRVLYGLLGRLLREGTAIVMVTHDLDEVSGLSPRVAVMEHGRLAFIHDMRHDMRHDARDGNVGKGEAG